jgi:heptosyltransferase-2
MIARLVGAGRRIGYARDARGWLLTDGLEPARRDGKYVPVPALDYYNDLARAAGCKQVDDQLILAVSQRDEEAIDRRLGSARRPLVVLNPGANYGSAKCWPAEKYAALADRLTERFAARVVASLGPHEGDIAARLAAATQNVEIFHEPPLGLGPLKALIKRCDLLVTNDTGPRHFAAAFGVPVVTVFGSSDPAWTDTRYSRERIVTLHLDCQPCMERVCPLKHHNCMNQLEPAMVLEKCTELLEKKVRLPQLQDHA